VQQMSEATTEEERIVLLRALGNAGDPRVLPLAERALGSAAAAERAAAAAALRFVEGPTADALLIRAMADSVDAVRIEALRSSPWRPAEPQLDAVTQIARHDDVEDVRSAAVDALTAFARTSRQAALILREVAASDPSADVRARASAAAT
jgi:HEAT repeat protein